jgi:hypothetical protein
VQGGYPNLSENPSTLPVPIIVSKIRPLTFESRVMRLPI